MGIKLTDEELKVLAEPIGPLGFLLVKCVLYGEQRTFDTGTLISKTLYDRISTPDELASYVIGMKGTNPPDTAEILGYRFLDRGF